MTVVEWAESNWIVPETGNLIVLRPWQRASLLAMFPPDRSPSRYETFLISTVKKAGKTTLNGVATLYAVLTRPGETAYVVANDEAQARARVRPDRGPGAADGACAQRCSGSHRGGDRVPRNRLADRRDSG